MYYKYYLYIYFITQLYNRYDINIIVNNIKKYIIIFVIVGILLYLLILFLHIKQLVFWF